jgi:hypothetical protein
VVNNYKAFSEHFRPRLFYLLDYGFLPQSEVGGGEKKLLRDPKVQIITVGHYCNLKMVVSHAQLLFVWSPCTTVYRFDGRFKHLASARRRNPSQATRVSHLDGIFCLPLA